jgi:hypothetical protein
MKSISNIKHSLEAIPASIWQLIEISPDIRDILWGFYQEEFLFATSIEVQNNNKYKVSFKFPPYKIIKWWLWHVSAAQMQIAIFQWLFCSIGLYIKNTKDSIISFETYMKNRSNALYRRDNRTFTKQLSFQEEWYLIFEITNVQKKNNIYSITCKLVRSKETFIHWEIECVLEEKYI